MKVEVNGNVYRKVGDDRWVRVADAFDISNEIDIGDVDSQDDVARKMLNLALQTNNYVKPVKVDEFLSESMIIVSIEFVGAEESRQKLLLWYRSDRQLYRKGNGDFWNDARAVGLSLPDGLASAQP